MQVLTQARIAQIVGRYRETIYTLSDLERMSNDSLCNYISKKIGCRWGFSQCLAICHDLMANDNDEIRTKELFGMLAEYLKGWKDPEGKIAIAECKRRAK